MYTYLVKYDVIDDLLFNSNASILYYLKNIF